MAAGDEILLTGMLLTVLAMVMASLVVARRYKKAPPNKALVVYGRRNPGGPNFKIIPPGGGMFVPPNVMSFAYLDLSPHRYQQLVPNAITKQGVPLAIDLYIIYRISTDIDALKRAAGTLLDKSAEDIENLVHPIVDAKVRATAANLAVEQINSDRDAFANAVLAASAEAFSKLGLECQTLLLRDVTDEVGYMEALGKARTAEVKRDAIIKEATARRDAIARAAELDQEGQIARNAADEAIARDRKARGL